MKKINLTLTALIATTLSINVMAAKNVFYPNAKAPKIQFLQTINGSNFLHDASSKYGNRFPGWTPPVQKEKKPIYKAFGTTLKNGTLYVADATKRIIHAYDMKAKTAIKIGAKKLKRPLAIAVDNEGFKYVADMDKKRIVVFNSINAVDRELGNDNLRPADIKIFKNQLYVLDLKESQVVVMNKRTGQEIRRIGRRGSDKGELFYPTNIALTQTGEILVSDTLNGRVEKFSNNGEFQGVLGTMDRAIGSFARPKGIAVDKAGRVYVADSAFENVQIFNKANELLLFFGEAGNTKAGLNMPSKITIDYDHTSYFKNKVAKGYEIDYLVLVSSTFGNNKVNVYGFLKEKK